MNDTIRAKLIALGYKPAKSQLPVTKRFVVEFEQKYQLKLPAEYRAFVLELGGWTGSATCDFLENPTPLGGGAWVDFFNGHMPDAGDVGDLRWATESVGGAPSFVCVAEAGMNGCVVVLRCGGPDDGHVYFLDADQRSLWTDKHFSDMFPGLADNIKEYLRLRTAKKLPAKPEGYENLYLLARGFNEFVERLKPVDWES